MTLLANPWGEISEEGNVITIERRYTFLTGFSSGEGLSRSPLELGDNGGASSVEAWLVFALMACRISRVESNFLGLGDKVVDCGSFWGSFGAGMLMVTIGGCFAGMAGESLGDAM